MRPPFRSIYFDCDSTLTLIEGIDEICQRLSIEQRAEISELTERAMNGEAPLAEVYETRLALLAPSAEQLDTVGELYVERAVPHTDVLIAALQHLDKTVGIVSGGLLPPVLALAEHLGVPPDNVHAVPIEFEATGAYRSFDRASLLWRNGGKPELFAAMPPQRRPIAFVGDGITDLETKGTVDLFVGFGGVVRRPAVEAAADAWLPGPDLRGLVDLVLTDDERQTLRNDARFEALWGD